MERLCGAGRSGANVILIKCETVGKTEEKLGKLTIGKVNILIFILNSIWQPPVSKQYVKITQINRK